MAGLLSFKRGWKRRVMDIVNMKKKKELEQESREAREG